MARLTIVQKHARFAAFFLALSRPHIVKRMQKVGFTPDHWNRAWNLIRQSVDTRLGLTAEPVDRLSAITDLERQWMPVVQTTLEMNYPALHGELIGNYQRVSGPVLLPLMQEVVRRIEALELSPDPERQEARALLAERGFTSAVVAEMKTAIDDGLAVHDAQADGEKLVAEADEAMWSFYLEWSRMARAVITDRFALRQLGFLRTAKPAEPQAPAALPPAQPVVTQPVEIVPAPAVPALPPKSTPVVIVQSQSNP